MNDDTVVGHAKATYGLPNSREFLACHLDPEYRALLEEAEETQKGLISGFNEENIKVRNLSMERDALKANLDEAMRLLSEAALYIPLSSGENTDGWHEDLTAFRERIGK